MAEEREMAVIEGFCVDSETGEPIMMAPVEIRDETGRNIVAETHTNTKGEFSVSVPAGARYQCVMFGQIYQPVIFKITDENGEWTPIGPEGRRIRIESVKVTLTTTVPPVVKT